MSLKEETCTFNGAFYFGRRGLSGTGPSESSAPCTDVLYPEGKKFSLSWRSGVVDHSLYPGALGSCKYAGPKTLCTLKMRTKTLKVTGDSIRSQYSKQRTGWICLQ